MTGARRICRHKLPGPPLAAGEMAMPDKASVFERLLEKPEYVASLQALYGQAALEDAQTAYDAMTDAIAAFEKTDSSARLIPNMTGG